MMPSNVLASESGMRFFRLADFRHFWTKTIISEIDTIVRSPNAYIGGGGGGGTHKLNYSDYCFCFYTFILCITIVDCVN